MVQDAEYVNGQYTYKYKQHAWGRSSWDSITYDGWGVQLIDEESTDPVTTKLCTYINDKPQCFIQVILFLFILVVLILLM